MHRFEINRITKLPSTTYVVCSKWFPITQDLSKNFSTLAEQILEQPNTCSKYAGSVGLVRSARSALAMAYSESHSLGFSSCRNYPSADPNGNGHPLLGEDSSSLP